MASRRAALAAGAALPAALVAVGASSTEVECNAPLSDSFELIQEWEVDDVSREIFGAGSKDSGSGSSIVEIRELGNGWLAADDTATTRSVLALGRDLATDPRVQAAVMERVNAASLKAPSKLLEELKLVLVAREVVADGTNETTPTLSRHSSAVTPDLATEEAHVESAKEEQTQGAGAAEDARGEEQPADEPSLGAALLESALVIASVIILTAVARRLNPKACTLAAAALAGAWGALFGGFKTSAAARGK